MCGSASGQRDLQPDPPVVGDRQQGVDRVQLAAGLVPGSARRDTPRHSSKRRAGSSRSVCATASRCSRRDVEGQLVAVDDDLLDRVVEADAGRPSASASASTTSSKQPPYGRAAGAGQRDRRGPGRRSRRCRRCPGRRTCRADADDRRPRAGSADRGAGAPVAAAAGRGSVGSSQQALHLRRSASPSARPPRRPRGGLPRGSRRAASSWILSCSLRIASSSISGRGGQPGR